MDSKERRQLLNKISARKFRNKRKEYVNNLEKELEEQIAENSQLKLEINWLKTKMEEIQNENDKLRLDLMIHTVTQPTSLDESNQHLSTPPDSSDHILDNWDLVLPGFAGNSFISQAVVPTWNHVFLSKEQGQHADSADLLKHYPLLAPALMSIVLSHTMTMNTDQLIASTRLLSPISNLPTKKEVVCESLDSTRVISERKKIQSNPKETFSVVSWLQCTIFNLLCEMVAERSREEEPFLSRSYQKAKKYIKA
ncbi:hypothetical protein G6F42_001714 [Rhizopus arrhizus]|nr:hypothetical protein G6F42_001714 [Rhizopus arrhizus]